MEKTFTKTGNGFFKTVAALIITIILMLVVKKVAAHKIEFYSPSCFTSNAFTSCAINDTGLIGSVASVLPVDLLPLQAAYSDGIMHLNWGTLQESNSSHFEVEHSVNAYNFTSVGSVTANGISSLKTIYRFNHLKAVAGTNYYRLRQVDRNGLFVYSNIISINVVIKGTFITAVYPSPFTDKLSVSISSANAKPATIRFVDITGRQIISQNAPVTKGVTIVTLNNLGNLSKGIYIMEVNCGGIIHSERLVK